MCISAKSELVPFAVTFVNMSWSVYQELSVIFLICWICYTEQTCCYEMAMYGLCTSTSEKNEPIKQFWCCSHWQSSVTQCIVNAVVFFACLFLWHLTLSGVEFLTTVETEDKPFQLSVSGTAPSQAITESVTEWSSCFFPWWKQGGVQRWHSVLYCCLTVGTNVLADCSPSCAIFPSLCVHCNILFNDTNIVF